MNNKALKTSGILMLLVLLFHGYAIADDGGPEYDSGSYLEIKAAPLSDSIEIGEDFKFRLELTNKSSKEITLREICQVFSGCRLSSFDSGYDMNEFDGTIEAGKKLTLVLSTAVPYTLDWYEKDGEYFADFDLVMNYKVDEFTDTLEESGEPYYGHENTELEKYPLKIANVKNGDELINISIEAMEDLTLIEDNDWWAEYSGGISHQMQIENKSKSTIDSLFVLDDSAANDGLTQIPADITFGITAATDYYLAYEDIKDELTAEYKVIFQIGGKYYVSGIKKDYPPKIISRPKLDIDFVSKKMDGASRNFLEFYNSSQISYGDFYVFIKDTHRITDEDLSAAETVELKPGSKYKAELSSSEPENDKVFFGYGENETVYLWNIGIYNDFVDFDYSFYKAFSMNDPPKSAGPDDTLEHAATPSPAPTLTPLLTSPPSPIPASTPAPTEILTSDQPSIEITSVKKTSSIPFWVWITLGAAVVGAAALIFALRRKSKDKKVDGLPHDD